MKTHVYLILVILLCAGLGGKSSGAESEGSTAKEATMENPIVFWELASNDQEKSVEFFRKVFDWNIEFDERLGFYTIAAGESAEKFWGGGIFTLKKAKLPFLTIYIAVKDISAKAKEVEAAGGYIVQPPNDLPSGSRICLFNDPSGVTFAMIEAGSAQ